MGLDSPPVGLNPATLLPDPTSSHHITNVKENCRIPWVEKRTLPLTLLGDEATWFKGRRQVTFDFNVLKREVFWFVLV